MKKFFAFMLVALFIMTPIHALAGEVIVEDAQVKQILVHGSYFDTDTFVVFFDKTAGGCDKMRVNTSTRQSEHAFQILLSAFESGTLVDYSMDPDSRWSGSSGLTCEMRYVWLKR